MECLKQVPPSRRQLPLSKGCAAATPTQALLAEREFKKARLFARRMTFRFHCAHKTVARRLCATR